VHQIVGPCARRSGSSAGPAVALLGVGVGIMLRPAPDRRRGPGLVARRSQPAAARPRADPTAAASGAQICAAVRGETSPAAGAQGAAALGQVEPAKPAPRPPSAGRSQRRHRRRSGAAAALARPGAPAKVQAKLQFNRRLWDASGGVQAAARGGVVTLTGVVPSREDIAEAEKIAAAVAGVTSVRNELRIGVPGYPSGAAN
jgi:hypothetical protein